MNSSIFLPVANRGSAPKPFIDVIVAWVKQAPDRYFARTPSTEDIYGVIFDQLGPWPTGPAFQKARRSAMCEVLRVLALFESSCSWTEGRDVKNASENIEERMSAGAWQISYDSCTHAELKMICHEWGIINAAGFRKAMMNPTNHDFALEYTVQLLRLNTRHNGPILRREINPWLSRDAMEEFKALLS